MENFFRKNVKKPSEKIFGLLDLDREVLLYRALPHLLAEFARKYFRLQVEGAEHIPRRGPALIAPNHSGYMGFDALLLSHEIYKSTGRVPRVLTHYFWFMSEKTAIPAEKVGFIEATYYNGMAQLNKNNLVVIFPEAEQGNFKPTAERYQLQEFRRGFVRMAIQRQCPIIPTLIVGAEETHINLAQLQLPKALKNLILPVPLNIVPLPAKWRIRFLPPINLPYKPSAINDNELVKEVTNEIHEEMQVAIREEVRKRGSAFFD